MEGGFFEIYFLYTILLILTNHSVSVAGSS